MDFSDAVPRPRAAIVGGGPSGLRAAEILAAGGITVDLYDAMPSPGRKFLVAGRGGLNLTHSEEMAIFQTRYRGGEPRWPGLLAGFSPEMLRAWARDLGSETFVGTSGRVFPMEKQSSRLLCAWVARLRAKGVRFHMRHRLVELSRGPLAVFATPDGRREERFDRILLAMGGASWPRTGSNGLWVDVLRAHNIAVSDLRASNCGWEVAWHPEFLRAAEGMPLKNIVATAGAESVAGELLVTRHGLEGGAIYRLGAALRTMDSPTLHLDLKPSQSLEGLRRVAHEASKAKRENSPVLKIPAAWKLSPVARTLLQWHAPATGDAAAFVKAFPVPLLGPRPIAEAISSAGGVCWRELDKSLMLQKLPGIFVAGEMIDWDAPTGGYLLQGCFSTATLAAQGMLAWQAGNSGQEG